MTSLVHYETINKELQNQVEQGYNWANEELGDMYRCGTGVKKDPDQAFKYYQKSLNVSNSISAEIGIAVLAKEGNKDSISWLQDQAEQGYNWANEELGDMYRCGTGVKKDPDLAFKYYQKSLSVSNSIGAEIGIAVLAKEGHQASISWLYEQTKQDDPWAWEKLIEVFNKRSDEENEKDQNTPFENDTTSHDTEMHIIGDLEDTDTPA